MNAFCSSSTVLAALSGDKLLVGFSRTNQQAEILSCAILLSHVCVGIKPSIYNIPILSSS